MKRLIQANSCQSPRKQYEATKQEKRRIKRMICSNTTQLVKIVWRRILDRMEPSPQCYSQAPVTDGTREHCKRYKRAHLAKIKLKNRVIG